MNKPIKIKIDVTKLNKALFFRSEKTGAVYCDLVAWPNQDGPGKYGDTHSVKQSKPANSDMQMPFVGNLTVPEMAEAVPAKQVSKQVEPPVVDDDDFDSIPF